MSQSSISIRSARPTDAKAVRMLLPAIRETMAVAVATDREAGIVVGAAALARQVRRSPLVGPGIAITVIEPYRRRGIARGLLSLLESAAANRFEALYGASRVDSASSACEAWKQLDFAEVETVAEHFLPLDQFEPRLAPLVDRFRRQGRIPDGAALIPLYRSKLDEVLRLHLDYMGGDRADLWRKLQGEGAGAFHPRYSRVLTIDGATRGCILAHRADRETAIVDANILDPAIRGGWANIWLKLEATRGALSLGIKQFKFTTFDHYGDTRSFTEKLGGATTRYSYLMMRDLRSIQNDNR